MVIRSKCPFCNYLFPTFFDLRKHIFQTHKTNNVKCPFCKFTAESWSDFAIHLLITKEKKHDDLLNLLLYNFVELVSRDNIFKVEITNGKQNEIEIENKDDKKIEIQDNNENQEQEDEILPDKVLFTCPYCKEKFDNINDLKSHIKKIHNLDKYVCPICNIEFDKYFKLLTHLWFKKDTGHQNLHRLLFKSLKINKEDFDNTHPIFYCPICNFCTSWHSKLYRHLAIHFGED